MKGRSPFFAACCIAATALSLSLASCNSSDSRAREAFSDYQAASAAGLLDSQSDGVILAYKKLGMTLVSRSSGEWPVVALNAA